VLQCVAVCCSVLQRSTMYSLSIESLESLSLLRVFQREIESLYREIESVYRETLGGVSIERLLLGPYIYIYI